MATVENPNTRLTVSFRATPFERELVARLAAREGTTISQVLRNLAVAAAAERLGVAIRHRTVLVPVTEGEGGE